MFGGASNNEYGAFLAENLSDIKLWHHEDHRIVPGLFKRIDRRATYASIASIPRPRRACQPAGDPTFD
jgi:hypothetical protein